MTYEEALKAKKDLGEITTIDGVEHYLYVVPHDEAEYERWKHDYVNNETLVQFTDERAKGYYQNPETAQYKVYGFFKEGFLLSEKELIP
ncbi:hypothetical protein [Flavobacterium panacis]|uniref:hypothetical protein n=1 Tax=Flavobacterium panacis TaxID=2962567 RepID=UPI00214DA7B0|nr:hypothetical protein [Flavobacterium panacis]MCR4029353.1 hypothetical protein [Flavobacterium panacis]